MTSSSCTRRQFSDGPRRACDRVAVIGSCLPWFMIDQGAHCAQGHQVFPLSFHCLSPLLSLPITVIFLSAHLSRPQSLSLTHEYMAWVKSKFARVAKARREARLESPSTDWIWPVFVEVLQYIVPFSVENSPVNAPRTTTRPPEKAPTIVSAAIHQ
jgi:hypothetical protein